MKSSFSSSAIVAVYRNIIVAQIRTPGGQCKVSGIGSTRTDLFCCKIDLASLSGKPPPPCCHLSGPRKISTPEVKVYAGIAEAPDPSPVGIFTIKRSFYQRSAGQGPGGKWVGSPRRVKVIALVIPRRRPRSGRPGRGRPPRSSGKITAQMAAGGNFRRARAPLARRSAVSFVEVSPSIVIRLKVRSTAS